MKRDNTIGEGRGGELGDEKAEGDADEHGYTVHRCTDVGEYKATRQRPLFNK